MPIYEFYSPQTNKIYAFFARSAGLGDRVPLCPDNPDHEMKKVMSGFAITGKKKAEENAPGGPDLDDPRLEAAMAQMEREFAGLDEENPDPRQMGQLMRRMADLTGEKLPGAMEEMVRRMEAGEDPEKLEEEYGDALEDLDMGDGPEGEAGADAPSAGALLKRLRGRRKPQRDPGLYEFSDYLRD